MKKKVFIVAFVIIILIVVIGNILGRREKALNVTVTRVKKMKLVEKVNATGEVKPKKFVDISSDVSGKIIKIAVKEGDKVKKGQFLLKIDSTYNEWEAERLKATIRSMEIDLKLQKKNLELKRRDYERYKKLWEEKLVSDSEYEQKKFEYENALFTYNSYKHKIEEAKASLNSAEEKIKKTIITSPIDGVVSSLNVEEGEVAIVGTMNNPGTVLMTIADLSVMEVEVEVDETDIVKVKNGERAEVTIDAFPDTVVEGIVTEVGSSAIQSSQLSTDEAKSFKVVITLKNPPEGIKPGLTASADIIVAEKEEALAVPISSIVVREVEEDGKMVEKEGVFVVENGSAKFVPVKKGIMGDMMVEIVEGVKEGDVIVKGPFKVLRKLSDGTKVSFKKRDKSESKKKNFSMKSAMSTKRAISRASRRTK